MYFEQQDIYDTTLGLQNILIGQRTWSDCFADIWEVVISSYDLWACAISETLEMHICIIVFCQLHKLSIIGN